jgi:hypothetical protein
MVAERSYAGSIDITRFPDDVVALIDALRPGEELVITRAGVPVATISSTGGVLHGDIVGLCCIARFVGRRSRPIVMSDRPGEFRERRGDA